MTMSREEQGPPQPASAQEAQELPVWWSLYAQKPEPKGWRRPKSTAAIAVVLSVLAAVGVLASQYLF